MWYDWFYILLTSYIAIEKFWFVFHFLQKLHFILPLCFYADTSVLFLFLCLIFFIFFVPTSFFIYFPKLDLFLYRSTDSLSLPGGFSVWLLPFP